MPTLYDKQTGAVIGNVSETDLQVMIDQLEEEDRADDDYFVDHPTIDILEQHGGSSALIALLRQAVGKSDGIDVRWSQ